VLHVHFSFCPCLLLLCHRLLLLLRILLARPSSSNSLKTAQCPPQKAKRVRAQQAQPLAELYASVTECRREQVRINLKPLNSKP
jgi:hypothetical protein